MILGELDENDEYGKKLNLFLHDIIAEDLDSVKKFVDEGNDLNCFNKNSLPPLIIAAMHYESESGIEIFKYLLENKRKLQSKLKMK